MSKRSPRKRSKRRRWRSVKARINAQRKIYERTKQCPHTGCDGAILEGLGPDEYHTAECLECGWELGK